MALILKGQIVSDEKNKPYTNKLGVVVETRTLTVNEGKKYNVSVVVPADYKIIKDGKDIATIELGGVKYYADKVGYGFRGVSFYV